jgi:GTP-dependent dephospho-CoA kinase
LPKDMRGQLAVGLGRVVKDSELGERIRACRPLMAVGDMVSYTLLDRGYAPDLIIYDMKTERRPFDLLAAKIEGLPGIDARVSNPAGQITSELVREIALALQRNVTTKLFVEGEEDLAALACAAMAPIGSCLVYGVPGEGMALLSIDQDVAEQARSMIYSMEELN